MSPRGQQAVLLRPQTEAAFSGSRRCPPLSASSANIPEIPTTDFFAFLLNSLPSLLPAPASRMNAPCLRWGAPLVKVLGSQSAAWLPSLPRMPAGEWRWPALRPQGCCVPPPTSLSRLPRDACLCLLSHLLSCEPRNLLAIHTPLYHKAEGRTVGCAVFGVMSPREGNSIGTDTETGNAFKASINADHTGEAPKEVYPLGG